MLFGFRPWKAVNGYFSKRKVVSFGHPHRTFKTGNGFRFSFLFDHQRVSTRFFTKVRLKKQYNVLHSFFYASEF